MENEKIKILQDMINASKKIVFFGGAGVSTESGLKDFRSVDGLYNEKYDYPPEMILSRSFFYFKPDIFYEFYKDKLLIKNILPNKCHYKLKELEEKEKLLGVITQNIDNLHTLAGSKNVIELHGTIMKNHCIYCNKSFEGFDIILNSNKVPRCDVCGNMIKPDVVLYEEALDEENIENAIKIIKDADMLIIGGCSLTVYPAASFIDYFKGKYLVVINKSPTKVDYKADLVISDSIAKVMEQIIVENP